MGQLKIDNARKVHDAPAIVAVDLAGVIEGRHYAQIDRSISGLRAKGVRHFVFDLSKVRFVNEPDQLAERHRIFWEEGGGLALVQVPPKLRVVFDTLGLDKVMPVRGTVDQAIGALVRGPVDRRDTPERRTSPDRRLAPPPAAPSAAPAPAAPAAPAGPAATAPQRRRGPDRRKGQDRRATAATPALGFWARLLVRLRRR